MSENASEPEILSEPEAKKSRKIPTVRIVRAAVIAAMYASMSFIPGGQFAIQLRVSEALTVLPLFFAEAAPGLFIGCIIYNLIGWPEALNVALGSAATLIAAALTYCVKRLRLPDLGQRAEAAVRFALGAIPPVVVNALLVPVILLKLTDGPYGYFALAGFIAAGQAAALLLLGAPLYYAVGRTLKKIPSVKEKN